MWLFLILPLWAVLTVADTVHVRLPTSASTIGVWHFTKASADIPHGAVSPKLVWSPQSSQIKAPPGALVSVSLDIDAKGLPFNIRIEKSSDEVVDDEVIAMIREWRFEAALIGRVAVNSHAQMDLSAGSVHREGPYFVSGRVAHPGKYSIDDAINASQALTKAGGVLEPSGGRIYIVRGGDHQKLRFSGTLDPQLERVSMGAGDHIMVP